jgi:hypothetical protein
MSVQIQLILTLLTAQMRGLSCDGKKMSEVSEAVDDVISVLEAKFSSSDDCMENVLKTLMFATTNALLATENDECGIVFKGYKSTFKIEPVE